LGGRRSRRLHVCKILFAIGAPLRRVLGCFQKEESPRPGILYGDSGPRSLDIRIVRSPSDQSPLPAPRPAGWAKGVPRLPRLGFPPGPPFRGAPWKRNPQGGNPSRPAPVMNARFARAARALGEARGPTAPGAALRVTPFADRTPLAAPIRPLKGAPLGSQVARAELRPSPRLHRCVGVRSCSMRAIASPAGEHRRRAPCRAQGRRRAEGTSASLFAAILSSARAWPRCAATLVRRSDLLILGGGKSCLSLGVTAMLVTVGRWMEPRLDRPAPQTCSWPEATDVFAVATRASTRRPKERPAH